MAKKLKLVDKKVASVIGIIEQASEEITGWVQDAATTVQEINTQIGQINKEIQEETITPEDGAVRLDKDVGKLYGKLQNRIKRTTKNVKAMSGLLNAIKAMQDEEEK